MSRLWMVAYDISDDGVRGRVRNILKDFGTRVQYSVFECWLTEPDLNQVRSRIQRETEPGDSVRWYPLCSWCKKEIILQGNGRFTTDGDYFIV